MPHHDYADGSHAFKPTDAELAIQAEGARVEGESLEHAIGRFLGLTASMSYVFSDPPEAKPAAHFSKMGEEQA